MWPEWAHLRSCTPQKCWHPAHSFTSTPSPLVTRGHFHIYMGDPSNTLAPQLFEFLIFSDLYLHSLSATPTGGLVHYINGTTFYHPSLPPFLSSLLPSFPPAFLPSFPPSFLSSFLKSSPNNMFFKIDS